MRETVHHTCGARTTPIPSQRARNSSVGKTPSFSFCQVDMYERTLWKTQSVDLGGNRRNHHFFVRLFALIFRLRVGTFECLAGLGFLAY